MVDKLHVVRDEYVFNDYASFFVFFFFFWFVERVLLLFFIGCCAVRSLVGSRAFFYCSLCHYVHFTIPCTQATVAVGNTTYKKNTNTVNWSLNEPFFQVEMRIFLLLQTCQIYVEAWVKRTHLLKILEWKFVFFLKNIFSTFKWVICLLFIME